MNPEEEAKEIEDEIARTQYNKATEKHIGKLKAKIALLCSKIQKKSGKKGAGYSIKKHGDATVLLVGFPSVGKSTLLNQLTNAESKVGDYDFTTLDVIPGVMEYKGAKIQILDVPGLVEGAASGRGRGREILSVVRNADLILIMVDVEGIDKVGVIEKELYEAGFRLNKEPPQIKIDRKSAGGVNVTGGCFNRDTVVSVLREFGIHNADVVIAEDSDMDRLIDALMKNRVYVPAITIVNKADRGVPKTGSDSICISALRGTGINGLKELIWKKLRFMRIYMKRPGKEPDMKEPLVIREGSTVEDVCRWVHGGLKKQFRSARVWGPSARFPGQGVGLKHGLVDGDVLELNIS